jgi:hypothetical protein
MDAFEKLLEVTLRKVQDLDGAPLDDAHIKYFENRLNDIFLFHKNLPDDEQEEAQGLFDEKLKSFFLNKLGHF